MLRRIIAGNIYHVLSRGVDKRKIFLCKEDYFRFIHDLFEFNDKEPSNNLTYFFRTHPQSKDIASPYIFRKKLEAEKPRKLLVEILAFCLMPNHYHLLLKPLTDGGLSLFMKKLNIGYAKYFNEKYERKGTLFEGRYKSVAIATEAHFIHIPYYIHLNPLDLFMPEWRERKISDYKKALAFLENYRWSSFPDYIGKKNFPSVTNRAFLTEFFGGPEQYKNDTVKWLSAVELEEIRPFILD